MFKICFRSCRIEISKDIFWPNKASQVRQGGGGSAEVGTMSQLWDFFFWWLPLWLLCCLPHCTKKIGSKNFQILINEIQSFWNNGNVKRYKDLYLWMKLWTHRQMSDNPYSVTQCIFASSPWLHKRKGPIIFWNSVPLCPSNRDLSLPFLQN